MGPAIEKAQWRGLPIDDKLKEALLTPDSPFLTMNNIYQCGCDTPIYDRHGDPIGFPTPAQLFMDRWVARDVRDMTMTFEVPCPAFEEDDRGSHLLMFSMPHEPTCSPYWDYLPLDDHEKDVVEEMARKYEEALMTAGTGVIQEMQWYWEGGEVDPETSYQLMQIEDEQEREAQIESYCIDFEEVREAADLWKAYIDLPDGFAENLPAQTDVFNDEQMQLIRRWKIYRRNHRSAYFTSRTAQEIAAVERERYYV